MEITQVGVRNRARATAMVTEETADNSRAVKRRKLGHEKTKPSSSTIVQAKILDCDQLYVNSVLKGKRNDSGDAAASRGSDGVPASCCSSTGSMEKPKVSDVEESVETGATARYDQLPVEKMPPEAELEEFFMTAQKVINENFKNKYNYDTVNDIPLKGRFKWIQVKQGK